MVETTGSPVRVTDETLAAYGPFNRKRGKTLILTDRRVRMRTSSENSGSRLGDVAFGLLCVVAVAAILLGQVVSLIAFDATGVDRFVPGVVIYAVAPAALMTALPATVAVRRYGRQRAAVITAGVFTAAITASFLTRGFFLIG
ncbi:hypothetical protein [Halorubrum ejinorense]